MTRMSRTLSLAVCLLVVAACDTGLGDDIGVVAPPTLRLELRDDGAGSGSNDAAGLQEAVAIVHAAAAHVAGSGWHTIMEGRVEVDFLRLADSAADLGIANIPAGKVTQIRLYVLDDEEAYVTDASGARHPLLTPSGSESGIKVKGLWSIGECQAGTLVLSTNGKKAIHIHGRGADDSYILRPVIRADRFDAEDIDGCVPGSDGDVPGSDGDGDLPGSDGDGDVPGSDGDLPGGDEGAGGDDGEGDADDGEVPLDGCYSPESGDVVDCEGAGAGSDGGESATGGDALDPDGTGDPGSTGDANTGDTGDTGAGDTAAGGTDPDGTGDPGSTGNADGSGDDGTNDPGDTGGVDGSGDDGSSGDGGASGGGTESDLCYSPESGSFYECS